MTNNDLERSYQLALSGLQSHDYSRSESICREALRLYPGEPNFLLLLAATLHGAGRNSAAQPLVREVLDLAPHSDGAHCLMGNILRSLGRDDEAIGHFRDAVRLNPGGAESHLQLGDLARRSLDYSAAERHLRSAVEHAPGDFRGHMSLGDVLLQMERWEGAIARYQSALALAPASADMSGTYLNLAIALRHDGQKEAALSCLGKADPKKSLLTRLECLLDLKDYEAFFGLLSASADDQRRNISIAAISAYAAQQLGREDPHPFCPDPLSHVRIREQLGMDAGATAGQLVSELIEAFDLFPRLWQPVTNSTVGGYTTSGNVFDRDAPPINRLREILMAEIAKYRHELEPTGSALVRDWPETTRLHGWYVRFASGGYEVPHIHPYGWVSGVLYLHLPSGRQGNEGDIEFSLRSPYYPAISGYQPARLHRPEVAQLILFPSSLYHRTIPFHGSGEERISLAFDLYPQVA